LTITVTATNAGLVSNTAWVYGDQPDTDPSNNQAAAVLAAGIMDLIPAGSAWRYLDNGSDAGTAWRSVNFSDSNWSLGFAKLGYGEGDEATVVNAGPSPTNHIITTYFRQTFHVDDPADFGSLLLSLKRDDGAIVYLNGNEVFRSNMPTGAVSHVTLAASTTSGPDETAWFSTSLNSNLLYSGANVLAVETHQDSAASDDLSFDLTLVGYQAPPRLPTIVQQPQGQQVNAGGVAVFSVQASGTSPLYYQWFRDNAIFAGATSPTLTIPNAQVGNAGSYSVQVFNSFGSVFSNGAVLSVNP